ncbi:MAG: phage tail protein [Chloroflexi bacterium SZAS-1]|jgi:microcystin-dependent protein|nr:phage tail protein [Chloroflexi bacterium SZAS-1]HNP85588.1 tail fiber protein [Kouleothrix sp.]
MSDPFIAEIRAVGFNFAPVGWAFCDGQLLPISQNTALFALIGTTYGGNGTTNFALPDLRDRAPMFWGQGPGLSYYDEGQSGGEPTVTLLESEIPAHNHIAKASGNMSTTADPTNGVWSVPGSQRGGEPMYNNTLSPAAVMSNGALTPAGQSQPHNNWQPFLTLNFIIALQGIFPQRP